MNIYYDENMPYAQEFFADLGDLHAFAGRSLTAEQIADADVLLVRSITQVDRSLLSKNARLKFVGTATIGVDHIDQSYLNERNIAFHSAPGCNAVSVAEYVISALVVLSERYQLDLFSMTVGIVGAGNTGTRLSEKLAALGIKYCLCDPILAEQGDERNLVSLDSALACDVVSLHVPITQQGKYPTFHLLDEQKLANLNEQQILINACRGEVIDNQALLKLKRAGSALKVVLDVWENEPDVLLPLLAYCEIATAHIAGYSLEGKARGTEMLYQALCQRVEIPVEKSLSQLLPDAIIDKVKINTKFDQNVLNPLVKMVYDVRRDDGIFRQQIVTHGFDHIRKSYPVRREFSAVTVTTNDTKDDAPHRLGFSKATI